MDNIEIEVTEINKETSTIKYDYQGENRSSMVVYPCKIDFLRMGKGMAGFTGPNISYFKSNEPFKKANELRPKKAGFYGQIKLLKDVTLEEFQGIYNEFSRDNWVNASNLFEKDKGKFDCLIFWNKKRELESEGRIKEETISEESLM